jgi:glycosidase
VKANNRSQRSANPFLFACLLLTLAAAAASAQAQDAPQYGTPFAGVPDTRDINIYQVAIGEYSPTRDLQGVIKGLDAIKALGINVVYLMPPYPTGKSGSPYSIVDMGAVNPGFGTLADLRSLVDGAHSRGMAVILDWVGYETAVDHPWVTSHPDWYKRDGNGGIVKPFPDCAALNTDNPVVANAMIQYMRNWVFTANIDGFRCDWADFSEPAYWTGVIANLRGIASHKLIFLAEGSNEGSTSGCNTCGFNQPGFHYTQGFDLIFGENFYWNFMKKTYVGGESAKNVDGINAGEYFGASRNQLVARYMSNHDEFGSDGSPYAWMGGKPQVLSAMAVAALMRGVPFIYNGVEVGNTSPLLYPWNSGTINWNQDLTVLAATKQLLAFRNGSEAIRRGVPTAYTTENVVAFTKTSATQFAFVAVNVRNKASLFTLPAGIANAAVYDGFTGAPVQLGATLSLEPYQYLAYVNSVVPATRITLSPKADTLSALGAPLQLNPVFSPVNALESNLVWTSSDASVATVSAGGLISGIKAGTATITVKSANGNMTDNARITVIASPRFTVYFAKPDAWGAGIKIYWWAAAPTGSIADGSWPGVPMTLANGWYSHTFQVADSVRLIFNDGSSQTPNLSRNRDGWYANGAWADTGPGAGLIGSKTAPSRFRVQASRMHGISIGFPDDQEYTVTLTSLSGAILASERVSGGMAHGMVLKPRGFTGGIGLLRLTSRSGRLSTQKVIY